MVKDKIKEICSFDFDISGRCLNLQVASDNVSENHKGCNAAHIAVENMPAVQINVHREEIVLPHSTIKQDESLYDIISF